METSKKGCVYFFKHIGLKPIKIGYSTNKNPIERFERFKVYAPYGAELLGFIRTYEAKILETNLHLKFSSKRINGEWFEITDEDVNECINFYSNIEDVKEKNEFQIEFAKKIHKSKELEEKIFSGDFFNNYSIKKTDVFNKKIIIQVSDFLKYIKKEDIKKFLIQNKLTYKAYRQGVTTKKGVLFWEKTL